MTVLHCFSFQCGLQHRLHIATSARDSCGAWRGRACGAASVASNATKSAKTCSMQTACKVRSAYLLIDIGIHGSYCHYRSGGEKLQTRRRGQSQQHHHGHARTHEDPRTRKARNIRTNKVSRAFDNNSLISSAHSSLTKWLLRTRLALD